MMPRIIGELLFVSAAASVALVIRIALFSIYLIPSESMLPLLDAGDYVAVAKWPFVGVGQWWPNVLPHKRVHLPQRGEVVLFRAPPRYARTYIKRVIGLPGDVVALRHGIVILNDRPLPRWRVADLLVPVSPASPCVPVENAAIRAETLPDGTRVCRYPRYREMLPDERTWEVLDLGYTAADDFGPVRVPSGRLFLLGDNRDRSADSRSAPREGGGVGMVPRDALVGSGWRVIFSTDGSARLTDPASWWRSMRHERIGSGM